MYKLTLDRPPHNIPPNYNVCPTEGKHPRGRIYHAVMSYQDEHERWFERADFFTPCPADVLVVKTVISIVEPLGLSSMDAAA